MEDKGLRALAARSATGDLEAADGLFGRGINDAIDFTRVVFRHASELESHLDPTVAKALIHFFCQWPANQRAVAELRLGPVGRNAQVQQKIYRCSWH